MISDITNAQNQNNAHYERKLESTQQQLEQTQQLITEAESLKQRDLFIALQVHLKNFYDVTYCVLSMDRWTNQPEAVDS